MTEARLRALLRQLSVSDGVPASFESVVTPPRRRRWRLDPPRTALAAVCLIGVAVVLLRPAPHQPPMLAVLATPPTTDWLLETPRADWLTHITRHTQKE